MREFLPLLLLLSSPALPQGYPPDEAVTRMRLPPGLEATLVASEPMVRQPVAIELDDRGRLWVIQYLQYPNPAGLRRVKVDRYSRTVYDRVPGPPPRGPKGADRITILEDADGDGRADGAHDFVAGLNLATGLAFGHGGVFVAQVPYLLFYPDRDRDDRPDSDPEVLLEGFGMEDASSVVNSLVWGPDGWLYGAQGSTVTANVRGIGFQQGVWRYHPLTKAFELFHEGGGNTWGLDFDAQGNLLASTNVGGYAMVHGVEGGYYWKQFEKHGPLRNPFAFGHLEHVAYEGFRGGHVTVGGMIYEEDGLPAELRGKYIAANLLSHAVYWHDLRRRGSTFEARHGGEILDAGDAWFAPSDLTIGPDGAVYVADFHDRRTAHPDPDAEWDRSNGRIYRLAQRGSKPGVPRDLGKLSSDGLVDLAMGPGGWNARRARILLAGCRNPDVAPRLRQLALGEPDELRALRALWALHCCGGFDAVVGENLLAHPKEHVRAWAVRLLGEWAEIPATLEGRLLDLARTDPSPVVRLQLAATARRLPAGLALSLADALASRSQDLQDTMIPLFLWWAVEKHAVSSRDLVLSLFARREAWNAPLAREALLERLTRRYAAEATEAGLAACTRFLESAPAPEGLSRLALALEKALAAPSRLSVPRALMAQLERARTAGVEVAVLLGIEARLGSREAISRALSLAVDRAARRELRIAAIALLGETSPVEAPAALLSLVAVREEPTIEIAAMDALRRFGSDGVGSGLLERYPRLGSNVRQLARDALISRRTWAALLIDAVESGRIPLADVPVDQARKVAAHGDPALDARVRKLWGRLQAATPEEKLAEVRRLANDLRAARGDPAKGKSHFEKLCGTCHRLFGEGKEVGPDLTAANRKDTEYLLVSTVDPGALVRREYLSYTVRTRDGRVLTGLVVEKDPGTLIVLGAAGERTEVARPEVEALDESPTSLMPEGLLAKLTPDELRDLFAYLQGD